jgi:hypothetical protein
MVSQDRVGIEHSGQAPLRVVLAYTPAGYVSGSIPSPGEVFPYVHDFGSILVFIENNFLSPGEIGEINAQNQYLFVDAHVPDGAGGNIPLADFLPLTTARQFESINVPTAWQSFDANYFLNYTGPILDPENDAIDND